LVGKKKDIKGTGGRRPRAFVKKLLLSSKRSYRGCAVWSGGVPFQRGEEGNSGWVDLVPLLLKRKKEFSLRAYNPLGGNLKINGTGGKKGSNVGGPLSIGLVLHERGGDHPQGYAGGFLRRSDRRHETKTNLL